MVGCSDVNSRKYSAYDLGRKRWNVLYKKTKNDCTPQSAISRDKERQWILSELCPIWFIFWRYPFINPFSDLVSMNYQWYFQRFYFLHQVMRKTLRAGINKLLCCVRVRKRGRESIPDYYGKEKRFRMFWNVKVICILEGFRLILDFKSQNDHSESIDIVTCIKNKQN